MQVAGAWRCRQCVTGAHSVRLCTNASPDTKPVQPVQVHVYPVTTALFWLLSACCWQLSDDDMPRNGVKYSRRHAKLMYCIDGGHNRAEICVRFWLTSCHAHRVYIYIHTKRCWCLLCLWCLLRLCACTCNIKPLFPSVFVIFKEQYNSLLFIPVLYKEKECLNADMHRSAMAVRLKICPILIQFWAACDQFTLEVQHHPFVNFLPSSYLPMYVCVCVCAHCAFLTVLNFVCALEATERRGYWQSANSNIKRRNDFVTRLPCGLPQKWCRSRGDCEPGLYSVWGQGLWTTPPRRCRLCKREMPS